MYRIALIVNEAFGRRVQDLALDRYVWVLNSSLNDPWIKATWSNSALSTIDPLLYGVSSFSRYPNETVVDLIVRVLEMIEEHHGEYAHDPPWSEVEVFGASLSKKLTEAAMLYGAIEFESTPEGFKISRRGST